MNLKSQNEFRELNPPAVIFARLAFLLVLLGWGTAVLLLVAGTASQNLTHVGGGILAAGIAFAIQQWLRRTHQWAEVRQSLQDFGFSGSPPTEFSRQVQEWETMRTKRGTPGFDAWEFLRLQREIESKAREDPRLAAFWQDHRD